MTYDWKRRVPDGDDVVKYRTPYTDHFNDLQRLENVVIALLDTLTGQQRLDVLNKIRGRQSLESDHIVYVADEPEENVLLSLTSSRKESK